MKISVIVPCYNAEDFILESLQSVNAQTLAAHEIIVIDDGSTDASLDKLRSCKSDIKILHTDRKGGAGARNAGIRAASGDWIAFLDADDVWYPTHLQNAVEAIDANDIVGYINNYDEQHLPERAIRRRSWPFDSSIVGYGLAEYIDVYSRYGNFVGMSACLVEKKTLDTIGGFDESMIRRHDIECWLRVVSCRRWFFDNITSSLYRKNREGSLSEDTAGATLYRFMAFQKHADELAGEPAFTLLRGQLARKALRSSYRFGTDRDRKNAYGAAYMSLDTENKLIYGLLRVFPFLFKPMKRAGLT